MILDFLKAYKIIGRRIAGKPGIYVAGKKIASLGFRHKNHIVSHGFSINILDNTELFTDIVVCGDMEQKVTSVEKEVQSMQYLAEQECFLESARQKLAEVICFYL